MTGAMFRHVTGRCVAAMGGSTPCHVTCRTVLARSVHTSAATLGKTYRRWDKKLGIATGTIIKRDHERLPRSEKLDVSEPQPDPSRGIVQEDGGVRYYGFVYYPHRDADGQPLPEPSITPTALHRVELIASLVRQPYWVREALQNAGLTGTKVGSYAVVVNSASVNALLYVAKHLVRIDPVTFPDGVPSRADLDHWKLLEDGRVVRFHSVQQVDSEYDQRYHIDGPTLKKRLRLRWIRPFWLDEKRTV